MTKNYQIHLFLIACITFICSAMIQQNSSKTLENGIASKDTVLKTEPNTGLVMGENYELVIAHCTACHSSKIILQYGATRETWLEKIRWMQQYHKLWDLAESEPKVLDYLAKYYPPSTKISRKKPLGVIQWYDLKQKN
jgi:hypothetical protein